MDIGKMSFEDLPIEEGIVITGAGKPFEEWVKGISKTWKDEGISKSDIPEDNFSSVFVVDDNKREDGGRTDLVMVFNQKADLNIGKMAMWRLRFGDCSWLSDFKDNYKHDYKSGS